MNDDVFVAKGYEHIWASSGHRLKWIFCGCIIDVEARAYVRTASYAPSCLAIGATCCVIIMRHILTALKINMHKRRRVIVVNSSNVTLNPFSGAYIKM